MLVAAVALAALTPTAAAGSMRSDWRACNQRDVIPCIRYAARKYRQPVAVAEQVATCESHDEWWASNGTDFGLYQFLPSTFAATPYGAKSYWSARWSALAAMWAWSRGWQHEWECYP